MGSLSGGVVERLWNNHRRGDDDVGIINCGQWGWNNFRRIGAHGDCAGPAGGFDFAIIGYRMNAGGDSVYRKGHEQASRHQEYQNSFFARKGQAHVYLPNFIEVINNLFPLSPIVNPFLWVMAFVKKMFFAGRREAPHRCHGRIPPLHYLWPPTVTTIR